MLVPNCTLPKESVGHVLLVTHHTLGGWFWALHINPDSLWWYPFNEQSGFICRAKNQPPSYKEDMANCSGLCAWYVCSFTIAELDGRTHTQTDDFKTNTPTADTGYIVPFGSNHIYIDFTQWIQDMLMADFICVRMFSCKSKVNISPLWNALLSDGIMRG